MQCCNPQGCRIGSPQRLVCLSVVLVAVMLPALPLAAQTTAEDVPVPVPQVNPEDVGLVIPSGPVKPGDGRRVLVQAAGFAEPVVGRVHVEAGNRLIVLLPDGRLHSLVSRDATATDRPFQPLTMAEMTAQLAGSFPNFKTRNTKRFLYIYNSSEQFYLGTSRILETMYPALLAYCKRQKIGVHDPEMPLVVVMFKTREDWARYSGALELGDGVVAYYDTVSNRVVMYEKSDLVDVAPELAFKDAVSTIAHEGVHQILHNIGVQQRLSRWPMWISEGLPEYFAPTDVGARVRWKGVGLTNDLRMRSLDAMLRQVRLPAPGSGDSVIKTVVTAEGLSAVGYAWSWALTHYLAERRKTAFYAYLLEISKLGPLERQRTDAALELFIKHFGSDFAALDAAVVQHLKSLPYVDPIENMTHYVVMIEVPDAVGISRRVGLTASPAAIKQLQQDVLAQVPTSLHARARFSIQAFPTRSAAQQQAARLLSGP